MLSLHLIVALDKFFLMVLKHLRGSPLTVIWETLQDFVDFGLNRFNVENKMGR